MRSGAEPRDPAPHCLGLLEDVTAEIRPDDDELVPWFTNYGQQHHRRLAMDLHLLEESGALSPLPRGVALLEFGAVPLLLTAAVAELGYDIHGLDVAPERFSRSIEELGLQVARCDVETEPVPFEDASFDVVLFNELFEHLRIDPIFTLREALRVLRPGGTLLLSTPNLRSFRGLKNLLLHHQAHAVSGGVYEQWKKLRTLGHMGHVREYTAREVRDFLGNIGFHVERVIYRGGHGRGVVGLAERLAPGLRPFFTLVARRPE